MMTEVVQVLTKSSTVSGSFFERHVSSLFQEVELHFWTENGSLNPLFNYCKTTEPQTQHLSAHQDSDHSFWSVSQYD